MKKMTTIAAAVTLATVSASAGAWWVNPWGDQTRILDAQREYTETLAAERARFSEQMAKHQAQVQAMQRRYKDRLQAQQARLGEQMAAQQAEAQAAQRKYAEQFAASQARIAEHMAAQQAAAQAAQIEYAKLVAAQQARVKEAQRVFSQPMVVDRSASGQDAEGVPTMPPPASFANPFGVDQPTWASPLNPFGGPLDTVVQERLKVLEARRDESRRAMESRREAALKKLRERRMVRPHYVDLRNSSNSPEREQIQPALRLPRQTRKI